MTQPHPEIELSPEQKEVLAHLRTHAGRSRFEIAQELGINNGVVTRHCQTLLSLGLIQEAEAQRSGRGRPSVPLHLRHDGAYAIGAALHPGWVDVAVVDLAGTPITQGAFDFTDGDPLAFSAALDAYVSDLAALARLRRARFLGYGVCVPGFATGSGSHRHTVERLRSWRGQDLPAVLGAALGGPTWVENDANAAALAEYYDADWRTGRSMLVLYMGYGVGGGCIMDGRPFLGEHFNAGEIGILFPLDQPRPSALDLLQRLSPLPDGGPLLRQLAADLDAHSQVVRDWAVRAAEQLRLAVLSGIAWLDPAAVVISGTLPDRILEEVTRNLQAFDWAGRLGNRPAPALRPSRLGGMAAALGAALLPIHQTLSP